MKIRDSEVVDKTISLMGDDVKIKLELDSAICVYATSATSTKDYKKVDIKLGQEVRNIKILESGSIIFMLGDDDTFLVTGFPQMFGFPTKEQLDEVIELEDLISRSGDRVLEIYDDIERVDFQDMK